MKRVEQITIMREGERWLVEVLFKDNKAKRTFVESQNIEDCYEAIRHLV